MVDLTGMTVVALRQFAKENKIVLGTGLPKSEIIEKIQAALDATEKQGSFLDSSTSADSKSRKKAEDENIEEEPKTKEAQEQEADNAFPKVPPIKPGPHNDIVYSTKPAWQARPVPPTRTGRHPSIDSGRSGAFNQQPSRFGPASVTSPTRLSPPAAAASNRFGPANQGAVIQPSQGLQGATPRQEESSRAEVPPALQGISRDNRSWQPPKSIGGPVPSFHELTTSESLGDGKGILEVLPDGFGFLRDDSFSSSSKDIYVSNAQIKRFSLRTGDQIEGKVRLQKDGERYSALLYINKINGLPAEEQQLEESFSQLTPAYPNQPIAFREAGNHLAGRFAMARIFAPLGFGQRSLITLDNETAFGSLIPQLSALVDVQADPSIHLISLFFNQSPENAPILKADENKEVFVSTFDQPADVHVRMADLVLGRAKRLTEKGKKVILFVDNIAALTHAYQALSLQNIRGSAFALAPSALGRTLQFFGTARNTLEAGSLTMIAVFHTGASSISSINTLLHPELVAAANCNLFARSADLFDQEYAFDYLKGATKKAELLLSSPHQTMVKAVKSNETTISHEEISQFLNEVATTGKSTADMISRIKKWVKK